MERMTPEQLRAERAKYETDRDAAIPNMDWSGWLLAITTLTITPGGTLVGAIAGKAISHNNDGTVTLSEPFEYVAVPSPSPGGAMGYNAQGHPFQIVGATQLVVRPIAIQPLENETSERRHSIACARFQAETLAKEVVVRRTEDNHPADGKSRIITPPGI